MSYKELLPHPALSSLIDAYWITTGDKTGNGSTRIMSDGCIDIIFNLGADTEAEQENMPMKHGLVYLVGTMTKYKETQHLPDSCFAGVRFKPAAFSAFYRFASLHEIANTTIEFDRKLVPGIYSPAPGIKAQLDHFFMNRLSHPKHLLLPVIAHIDAHNGQLSIGSLVKKYVLSERQLERSFRQYLGISPKAYISFARYQYALKQIRQQGTGRSLADIAFECGYYDHAHLSNEIKKYSGLTPSQL